ncbi:MAG: large subunit ribosomal protein [Frankiaceae bacterium]|jgi:large subunit ribosomal protein L4|nr:large subunit ribosomal protein [Frankiaceae bacterium]
MATVNVQSPQGDLARTIDLPDAVFDVQVNVPLIHQVVVAQLAAARQGTHDTKTRGEVRGGGRKPYKQKGTGRARQGSTRAPQFAGGGTVHGPTPRNYEQRTPKKMKAAALRGALSDRARGGRLHVVSALVEGDAPSTKAAALALAKIVASRHVLVVAEREDVVTWKSLRNVDNVHLIAPDQLNTYDVLVSDDVVFTEGALAAFLNKPGTTQGKALGAAVETLAAESAPKGGRRTAASAEEKPVTEPATDKGETKPAGEDVSDAEAVAEVAEQTSPDLAVDPAAEAPAEAAQSSETDETDDDAAQGGEA